jgi:hypothetical protein
MHIAFFLFLCGTLSSAQNLKNTGNFITCDEFNMDPLKKKPIRDLPKDVQYIFLE